MENNKFLYVIFTICVIILVLLIVQMFLLVPAVMHGGYGHHSQPMCASPQPQAQAPAQYQQMQAGFPGPAPCHAPGPMFKCGPGFHHFSGKPMMPPKHPFFPQHGFKDGNKFGDQKPGDKPMPGQPEPKPGPKPGPKAPAEPQQNK